MTEKRFTYLDASKNHYIGSFFCNSVPLTNKEVVDLLNENEELKQDVDYWKQVTSQYINVLYVFENCKKYKTECKDIYWRGNE